MQIKKPKFWDLKKPNFISIILLPFTIILLINNFFLNKKIKKKNEKIKTICVGNIYIGGTGKTPTTIKIYELLKKFNFEVCTGKKLYSSHIDEKKILEKKTNLITEDNRTQIIEKAIKHDYKYLIFDDGLQDRNVSYDLKFVCFNSYNWIGNNKLIPAGPLREKISSLKKYDAVFLKKNNEINDDIKQKIKSNNPKIEIFDTQYEVQNLDKFDLSKKYLFFCGIGNPLNFKDTLQKHKFNIVDEIIFPDHFNYKKKDIKNIKERAKKNDACIITTEKDYVKISLEDKNDINYLDIDLKIENENKLMKFIVTKLNEVY
jgi:tetraacyldisaccharide 4'-kinase